MNAVSLTPQSQAMSSIEIANLTGKKHTNVIRDIKSQIFYALYDFKDDSDLSHVEIEGVTVILDNRGYWKEVLLDREHTLTLITGYDVKTRHKINKRWIELESGTATIQNQEPPKLQNVAKEYKGALALAKLVGYKDNQAHLAANKAVIKTMGFDVHQVMTLVLVSPVQSRLMTPTDIGNQLGLSGIKANKLLKDKGFQTDSRDLKNNIVWTPTDKGLKFAVLLDTNKKAANGTSVQQLKWYESVIEELMV